MKIRSITAALAATAALALAAVAAGPAYGSSDGGARPTIVLLHGAFADGSAWSGVTQRLQKEGFPVVVPAVPLRGVAADTAEIESVISGIPGSKVLVGHSYAGMIVSELAAKTPDVTALVYVEAFIPEAGESAGQLNGQFPGSELGPDTSHTVDTPDGPELFANTDSFREVFAADVPAADAAVAAASQRPILAAAFGEAATATAPADIPKYAVLATEDKAIPPAAAKFMAERAGAKITELRSSHVVPITHPKEVAEVISEAAGA